VVEQGWRVYLTLMSVLQWARVERLSMQRRIIPAVTCALAIAIGAPLAAQKMTVTGQGGGGSPHVKSQWTVKGATITLEYGRPYLKGRPESQLMPAGEPWRTGADEASIIRSDKPLTFGTVKLAANTPYTINTIPGDKWTLLLGKLSKPGQWGIPYVDALEIGRVPMTLTKAAKPVEQVTISIDEGPAGPALRVEWGTVSASAPFTVG
jgi:hypothetical protein